MPQNDPVVRRIPVRLTTTARADVQQQQQQQIEAATADAASSSLPLLLVQYPLQPHDQPPAVRALRAKPHSRQLEMETHLNAKSSMYDATRGENYANALNAQARARQRNAGGGTARNMFPFGGSGAVEQQARAAAGLTTTSMSSQRVTGENVSQHPNYVAGYLVDGILL